MGGAHEIEVAVIDPGSARTEPRKIDDGRGAWMDLCAHVIEAHGGTITLERDAGGGVAVRLRLPIWKG
jgi:K+-sensing histidine kinase KdpD